MEKKIDERTFEFALESLALYKYLIGNRLADGEPAPFGKTQGFDEGDVGDVVDAVRVVMG